MKSATLFAGVAAAVIMSLGFWSRDIQIRKNIQDFSISTKTVYEPGEMPVIRLYSYSYAQNQKGKAALEVKFTLYKIKDPGKFFSMQKSEYGIDLLGKDSALLTEAVTEVETIRRRFRPKGNQDYMGIDTSVSLSVTAKGAYLVRAESGNKVAHCGFFITGLSVISKAGLNTMSGYAADRKTGIAAQGAHMKFYVGSSLAGEGIALDGSMLISMQETEAVNSEERPKPLVIATKGEDLAVSDPYLYFGYRESRYMAYIFTEQPVYRAGTQVNYKGTVRKRTAEGYENLPDIPVNVVIKDPAGSEILREEKMSNGNGSFDGTITLADEARTGEYSIIAEFGNGGSGYQSFTVEQYRKPEYKVTVTTDKSNYFGKDMLNAEVTADYFFGSPVVSADVEYFVYRIPYYRPWWMFSEHAEWYRDFYGEQEENNSGSELIHQGSGKTDSQGRLDFSYAINEDFKQKNEYDYYRPFYGANDYRYIIQARVTDAARHEISGSANALVTRGGFFLSANASAYIYKPGAKAVINVNAADYSDKPVSTAFEAKIFKIKYREFKNENHDLVAVISGNTANDGKGSVIYDIPASGSDGSYMVKVSSIDSRNNLIEASCYFYVSAGDYSWFESSNDEIRIVTERDSYTEGEICNTIIVSPYPNTDIFITSETDNILFAQVKRLTGNSTEVNIPVTSQYLSGFSITVNHVSGGRHITSSKRVAVIPVKKLLTVEVIPSLEIYKPGDTGALKIKVTDNNGAAVPGAEVSIGIVDESIYSIKEDKTKSADKFFYGSPRTGVATSFDADRTSAGNSRLMTVFEKYKTASLPRSSLGKLSLTVTDNDGNPVPNAAVVIDELYAAGITDDNGRLTIELPGGVYTVGIELYGGTAASRSAGIDAGTEKTVTLRVDAEKLSGYTEDRGAPTFNGGDMPRTMRAETDAPRANLKMAEMQAPEESNLYAEAEVRSDFRDAVNWTPYSVTDPDGYAEIQVLYPDNLTTWRITSRVITGDTKAGQAVKTVITRKDLLVRLESPRFIREGDEVTLSAIIHNYLKQEKRTRVSIKADNALLIGGDLKKEIILMPDSEQRIDFTVRADRPSGKAKFFAEALTNEESDAVEVSVPLQATGLKLTRSVLADFDDPDRTETRTIEIPAATDLRSASLILTADPSLASAILTSMDDLIGYPYGCVEQTMSRFLPTIIVANAFGKLNAPVSEKTRMELPKMVSKGLARLYALQHSDGGWGWWENDRSNPFMTAYVVYGLSIAKETGYQVQNGAIGRGMNAMRRMLNEGVEDNTTTAYMLYSLAVSDSAQHEFVRKKLGELERSDVNNYGKSLIALTWKLIGDKSRAREALAELKKNAVVMQGESAAYWEGKQFHYTWQDDKVQTTAMALKALVNIDESSDLKDLVIRWLILQRQGTSWRSTQETAMIIYSLTDYLMTSKELYPAYELQVYVNNKEVLKRNFTEYDVFRESQRITISSEDLRQGANEIKIRKQGKGKIYFTSSLEYYKPLELVRAEEEGYRVEKEVFKLSPYQEYGGPRLTYKPLPFNGEAKSGDVLFVKVRVHSRDEQNNYFMLEDPLPSGFEYVKDEWAYPIEGNNDYSNFDRYYWRWWYADKDVRDDKVVYFATYFGKGTYEFSYMMKAEIPGEYTVNPAKGSLMYYPEVYGNTGGMKIKVTDR